MANKIFIMPGNSLCQDEYISDIKSSGGGGERWNEKRDCDIYEFIDGAEAVVSEVWGEKKTEIRDIRNQCKGRENGNDGETEGSMNFNHLKRLREG